MQMRLLEMDKRVKANEEWREKLGEMRTEFEMSLTKTNNALAEVQSNVSEIKSTIDMLKLKADESEVALVKVEQHKVGRDEIMSTLRRLDDTDYKVDGLS